MPQPRLTPDPAIHQNNEFLHLRHRVLIEGEAGVWPLGTSDGFSLGKTEATAGHMQWNNGKCTLVDPTSDTVEQFLTQGIPLETIDGIIFTHGHGDHFGDVAAQLLRILPRIKIYTTRTIFDHISAMYKSAIGGHREGLQQWNFQEVKPRQFTAINGLFLRFHYTCHTVPTVAYEVRTSPGIHRGNLVYYYSCDTLAEQGQLLDKFVAPDVREAGEETLPAVDADGDFVMEMERLREILRPFELLEETWDQVPPPMFCIEGGRVGIHTPFDKTFAWLKDFARRKGVTYEEVMRRVRVYHMADNAISGPDAAYKWPAGHPGFISFARQIMNLSSRGDRIQDWIHHTPLLSKAGANTRRQLAAAAEIVEIPKGEELPQGFVTIPIAGAFAPVENDKVGAVIQPFDVMGAAAVFDDSSESPQTVRALVPSQVLRIPLQSARDIFQNISNRNEREALRADWRSYLENVRIASGAVEQSRMSHLPQSILAPLFMAADQQHYEDGAIIVREGQYDDREHQDIYLVIQGHVRIQRRDGLLDTQSGRGTIFGEMAFVRNKPRSATVSAQGPVTVLRFSAQKMRHLMTHYPGIWIALSRLAAERRSVVH
jgi:CRP-like cAMP-binding protein